MGKYRMNDWTGSDKGGMMENLQAGRWGGKRGAVVTPLLPWFKMIESARKWWLS